MNVSAAARQVGDAGGLCPSCAHVKRVVSQTGSTFYLCRLAASGNGMRKYPPQPVRVCPEYRGADDSQADRG